MQLVVHFSAKKPESRAKRERGYYSDSDSEEEGWTQVAVPKKKAFECVKCGEVYEKNAETCRWHSGTYSLSFAQEVAECPSNNTALIDSDYDGLQHLHTEEIRQWTCCNDKNRSAVGCVSGTHQASTRTEQTFDQKLISFFTSNAALEAPSISTINSATANNAAAPANNDDDEDDDVQFIGRQRLLGNANPQGTVNLGPVMNAKKCFALNESATHSLESILFGRGIAPGIQYLESDCDAELLVTVGFNSNVRLSLIRLLALDVPHAPASVRIFINKAARINFDNAATMKPDQEFTLDETNFTEENVAVLQLQASKFTLVESVTLHITKNIGDEPTTIIQRLNFIGVAPNVR